MPRLIKLAAVLLVALWLPATLHCDFEKADVSFLTHDHHGHSSACHSEACHALEDAAYTASAPSVKVPLPVDSLSVVLAALIRFPLEETAEPALSPARHAPPPELRVAWQFLFRAAPPARAPALDT